jgi:hypothetical protein
MHAVHWLNAPLAPVVTFEKSTDQDLAPVATTGEKAALADAPASCFKQVSFLG